MPASYYAAGGSIEIYESYSFHSFSKYSGIYWNTGCSCKPKFVLIKKIL